MKRFIINSRTFMLLSFCFAIVVSGCKKGDFPHSFPGPQKLLVTGLEELQGSTVGPDKALYVTAPLAGSIWRVNPETGAFTRFALLLTMGRRCDVFDLPDLAGEANHVGVVADEQIHLR